MPHTAPSRLLVADDNELWLRLLGDIAKVAGLGVQTFADGGEMVAWMARLLRDRADGVMAHLPCGMFVNDFMPTPGHETLRAVHRLLRRHGLVPPPAVVTSAWSLARIGDDYAGLAGVRFLRKPCSIETLLAEMRRMCPGSAVA